MCKVFNNIIEIYMEISLIDYMWFEHDPSALSLPICAPNHFALRVITSTPVAWPHYATELMPEDTGSWMHSTGLLSTGLHLENLKIFRIFRLKKGNYPSDTGRGHEGQGLSMQRNRMLWIFSYVMEVQLSIPFHIWILHSSCNLLHWLNLNGIFLYQQVVEFPIYKWTHIGFLYILAILSTLPVP